MNLESFKQSVDNVPKEMFSDEQKKRAKKSAEDLMSEFGTDNIEYILDNLNKIGDMHEIDGYIQGNSGKWKLSTWKNSLSSFKTFVEKHCPVLRASLTQEVKANLSIYCKSSKKKQSPKSVSCDEDMATVSTEATQVIEKEDYYVDLYDSRVAYLEDEVAKLKHTNEKLVKQQQYIMDVLNAIVDDTGSKLSAVLFKSMRPDMM